MVSSPIPHISRSDRGNIAALDSVSNLVSWDVTFSPVLVLGTGQGDGVVSVLCVLRSSQSQTVSHSCLNDSTVITYTPIHPFTCYNTILRHVHPLTPINQPVARRNEVGTGVPELGGVGQGEVHLVRPLYEHPLGTQVVSSDFVVIPRHQSQVVILQVFNKGVFRAEVTFRFLAD